MDPVVLLHGVEGVRSRTGDIQGENLTAERCHDARLVAASASEFEHSRARRQARPHPLELDAAQLLQMAFHQSLLAGRGKIPGDRYQPRAPARIERMTRTAVANATNTALVSIAIAPPSRPY